MKTESRKAAKSRWQRRRNKPHSSSQGVPRRAVRFSSNHNCSLLVVMHVRTAFEMVFVGLVSGLIVISKSCFLGDNLTVLIVIHPYRASL